MNQNGQWKIGIGSFLQGFNQAREKADERQRQREEMDLRKKMIDAQIKQIDLHGELQRHQIETAVKQAGGIENLARMVEQQGAGSVTPTEGPATAEGVGPAPVVEGMKPESGLAASMIRAGGTAPFASHAFEAMFRKPEPTRPLVVPPGGTAIHPQTGAEMFKGPPKEATPRGPMSVAPGATVYDPSTGRAVYTAPDRPQKATQADVGPVMNVKAAKDQLQSMADQFSSKDVAKVKPALESKANQMGYTIVGVRPGTLYGWNVDIAPISKSARGAAQGAGGSAPSIEQRMKNIFGE